MNYFCKRGILAATFVTIMLLGMFLLDIHRERHFVHAAVQLEGHSESEIYRSFPRNTSRKGVMVMIGRKRLMSFFWNLCGCDSSVVVYLTLDEGRVARGAFSTSFPSMKIQEYR